jgi:hypothetical protein
MLLIYIAVLLFSWHFVIFSVAILSDRCLHGSKHDLAILLFCWWIENKGQAPLYCSIFLFFKKVAQPGQGREPGIFFLITLPQSHSVLPDGIFSNQKHPIWVYIGWPWYGKCWYILWLFVIFDSHLVYLIQLFGTFCGHLVYIFQFWYNVPRKIWQHYLLPHSENGF